MWHSVLLIRRTVVLVASIFAGFLSYCLADTQNAPGDLDRMLEHEVAEFSLSGEVSALAWSPQGDILAVSYAVEPYPDTVIAVFDVRSKRRLWTLHKPSGVVPPQRALAFSPDGSLLYIATVLQPAVLATADAETRRSCVSVVSARDGRVLRTLKCNPIPNGWPARAFDIVPSSDGKKLFVIPGISGDVDVFDTASWQLERVYKHPDEHLVRGKLPNKSHVVVDEARQIIVVSHSGEIHVFDLRTGSELRRFQAFQYTTTNMRLNTRTGELVAGGSIVVEGWRDPRIDPPGVLRVLKDEPHTLVRAFDLQTGRLIRTYESLGGTVEGLSVSHDGLLVAALKTGSQRRDPSRLLVWSADGGQLLGSMDLGGDDVGDIAFSPDSVFLAYSQRSNVHIIKLRR